ncbi:exo-alpha-sialidase [Arenibacter sp. BSSL-BM3]|uniref:Exo-alpha-sialidase n=1 Tax=Arenibacter arenosicollis TaxID=2762274 RepID=A0ABR7QKU8_9FLAO|nr:sialidase family protein [Arenibacter arenosicollis]MBC8767769.1 exo-alpha-sialidase [Arenibacter arenosicollis]
MKLFAILITFCISFLSLGQSKDWRMISNGEKIYEHGYCDQPYIVTTKDGTWVSTFTTSPGQEGSDIQYIVSTYSSDQGKTWSIPVEIEAASAGVEASWAMPLVTKFDRVYAFYTFNGDSVRNLPDGAEMRADTHGWYCYRYSDDKGKTWSKRYRLNMRKTASDRENDFAGEVQMFWGIGEPVSKGNDVWFSFTKLGKYFLEEGEGWVYHSDNILTEEDVSKINWQLLPEGDIGIKSPYLGSVQEEFNIQPMNIDNGLYCVYRTTLGQPAHAYSFDKGKTWSEPELMSYANGMPLRNPRACPRIWKCKNGKYLLWYHNNGETGSKHRNPAWVAGGIEKNGKIYWSQPEILIYGPDQSYETGRFSYPDLVDVDGKYWVSTTQKTTATIHEVPAEFFERLWSQFDEPKIASKRLIGSFENPSGNKNLKLASPLKINNEGFALDLWIEVDAFKEATILEGKDSEMKNMELRLTDSGTLEFIITNEGEAMKLTSDINRLKKGENQHVAILFDAQAKICYMLIDGSICDGGGQEIFGYSRFNEGLLGKRIQNLSVKKFPGKIEVLRLYGQQMFTSQFVNNFNSEKSK